MRPDLIVCLVLLIVYVRWVITCFNAFLLETVLDINNQLLKADIPFYPMLSADCRFTLANNREVQTLI